MPDLELPGFAEIESARNRIGAHAHWTPLLSSRSIGELATAAVWLGVAIWWSADDPDVSFLAALGWPFYLLLVLVLLLAFGSGTRRRRR